MDVGDGVFELDAEELEQAIVDGFVVLFELVDEVLDKAVGDLDAAFGFDALQGSEDELREVLGEDAGGFGVVDDLGLVGEVRGEGLELGGEVVGEELFVEAGFHYQRFELRWGRPSGESRARGGRWPDHD